MNETFDSGLALSLRATDYHALGELITSPRGITAALGQGAVLAPLSEEQYLTLEPLTPAQAFVAWEQTQQATESARLLELHYARQSSLLEQRPVCDACSTATHEVVSPCPVVVRLQGAGPA